MRSKIWWVRAIGGLCLIGVLGACGGAGENGEGASHLDGTSLRMSEGASIKLTNSSHLADVTVRVSRDSSGAPTLPLNVQPIGSVYQFGPVGTFAGNSEITVPFDQSAVPAGATPRLYYAAPDSEGKMKWVAHVGAEVGVAALRAEVPVLGFAFVGLDGLVGSYGHINAGRETTQAASGTDAPAASGQIGISFDAPHVADSTLTTNNTRLGLSVQYSLPDCSRNTRIVVHATHRPPGPTSIRTFDLGSFQVNASTPTGSVSTSQNMTSSNNGVWTYSATVQCDSASGSSIELVQSGPSISVQMSGSLHPRIVDVSKDVSKIVGEPVSLNVNATGSNVTYQWQISPGNPDAFVDIAGATAASYAFNAPAIEGRIYYRVVALNKFGVVWSQPIRVTVTPKAQGSVTVVSDPAAQTVIEGETASFTVVGSGTPVPAVQWQTRQGSFTQAEQGWSNIVGATTATYITPRVALLDSGRQYRAVLLSAAGSATSRAATLTVTQRLVAASITQQPAPITVTAGQAAAFSVGAGGSSPLSYQWLKNGVAIAGANASAILIPANVNDIGQTHQITVKVSNSAGSATSAVAAMTVIAPAGVEVVSAQMTAAEGGVLETSKSAALVVPAGALSANAKVTVLAQSADQVGLPAEFIPIGDAVTISTNGVAFTPNVTLNVPTPDVVEEGKVLALVELGDTADIVAFGAVNVQRLADGAVYAARSMAMAATPAVRVLCLDASHARFGTTVVPLDRVGRYTAGKVPESACTANAPRPTNKQIHSTSTAPCRDHEFVPTSAGTQAALISRHVYCESGSVETDLSEWVTVNGVNTEKKYGRHRLEYRLGTDGPSTALALNTRFRFRLVRIGAGNTSAAASIKAGATVECANSAPNVAACSHGVKTVNVTTGQGWSNELYLPVGLTWSRGSNAYDDYHFSQVLLTYAFAGAQAGDAPQQIYIGQPPVLRCDRGLAVAGGSGCVYADYPAVMLMALADPRWSEAAQHIKDAQAAGSPGALGFDGNGRPTAGVGQALRRNRFESVRLANREAACGDSKSKPSLWMTRVPQQKSATCTQNSTGCQCDEYPFASTWNGAAISPAQTSVRHIFGAHNEAGGSLLSAFYQYERVLDLTSSENAQTSLGGDDFWVHID